MRRPPTRQGARVRTQILNDYRQSPRLRNANIEQALSGSIKEPEACLLWDLIVQRKPSVVLQVGTFVGVSSLIMAEALRNNHQGMLVTVDPEIPHRAIKNPVDICRYFAKKRSLDDRIRFIRGWFSDSPHMDAFTPGHPHRDIPVVSQSLLSDLGPIDMTFIDGDHSTLSCISDFVAVKNHLSEKGMVLFHDVRSWVTVMAAVHAIARDVTIRDTFSMGGLWTGDGIFYMERIPGRQRVSLHLIVRDSVSEKPIVNARIRHRKREMARTDTNGGAWFEQVPSGRYHIDIEVPGYRSLENRPVQIRNDAPEQIITIHMERNHPSASTSGAP